MKKKNAEDSKKIAKTTKEESQIAQNEEFINQVNNAETIEIGEVGDDFKGFEPGKHYSGSMWLSHNGMFLARPYKKRENSGQMHETLSGDNYVVCQSSKNIRISITLPLGLRTDNFTREALSTLQNALINIKRNNLL